MIEFRCACGESLRVHEKHAGRRCKCPKCGSELHVPKVEQPESQTEFNSEPAFTVPDQPHSDDSLKTPDENLKSTQPSRKPYLWCRRLQQVTIWTGYLWFVIGAVAVMLFVRLGFTPAPDELMFSLATLAMSSPFLAISSFAMAELLGGTVAYFIKHDCHPEID